LCDDQTFGRLVGCNRHDGFLLIPEIGLGQARRWMERLARRPVSQYVLYTALLMVWLSSTPSTAEPWYNAFPVSAQYVPLLLVGPVLLTSK
jgi:hypothetical protein